MKKRIVSIWFPRLATDRIQRQRGAQWAARPLAAVVEAGNRIMLAGVNREAEQAGLAPGMTLSVESYVGEVGGREGVKLEQQILITEDGHELLVRFPFEDDLLGWAG